MKKNLIELIIYIIVGYTAYLCILVLDNSPNKQAYGLICGWWAAAYYANIFNLKINLIKYFFILWIIVLLADVTFDFSFFYEEGGRSDPVGYSLMSGLQFLFLISPLLFNYLNILEKSKIIKIVEKKTARRLD